MDTTYIHIHAWKADWTDGRMWLDGFHMFRRKAPPSEITYMYAHTEEINEMCWLLLCVCLLFVIGEATSIIRI